MAPLGDLLVAPGSAGLGAMIRSERSAYEGVGYSQDLVPLYLYEGKRRNRNQAVPSATSENRRPVTSTPMPR